MEQQFHLVGQKHIMDIIDRRIPELKNGQGTIIFVKGDTGYGKTHLLNGIADYVRKYHRGIRAVYTESQAPIGNFKVGSIQPLQPFIKALDNINQGDQFNPEAKFFKNASLTALSAVPILGEFTYAYKEFSRDIKEFKKEKALQKTGGKNSAVEYYYQLLTKKLGKKDVVLLFDDMHWCDSQSVDFLKLIIENLQKLPVIIVLSYRENLVTSQGLPIYTLLHSNLDAENIEVVELQTLELSDMKEFSKIYFDNYRSNKEFEEWIFEKSGGVPGVISEYLRYFSSYSPFDTDGNLVMNFKDNEFLPGTIQSVFAQHIEMLDEDEKNILTVCSAEGIEFSAYIASKLMNIDLLNTIKKLRSLQNKTGFIKSMGAQDRYGIKTTIYKFTQVFYHNFFENLLEYEERVELHARIASLLKEQFDMTDSDFIKNEIAPFLAAHSLESGDTNTAEEMLYLSALNASEHGSNDIIDSTMNALEAINPSSLVMMQKMEALKFSVLDNVAAENNGKGVILNPQSDLAESLVDFRTVKKSVISDLINNNPDFCIKKIDNFLNLKADDINISEQIQLDSLLAKAYIDIGDMLTAKSILERAGKLLHSNIDKNSEALLYNSYALYHFYNNEINFANNYIEKSINISNKTSIEIKLLTTSLIAIITKNSSIEKHKLYKEAAIQMCQELNFDELAKELSKV